MGSTNNNRIKVFGALLGLAAWTGYAQAADELDLALGEQDFFAELPVILTATRLPQQRADVPAAVTVIDRQMIEAAGVTDIPSLFRLVAGFQVGHDRESRMTVTYHGAADMFSRRMQVLVDGRSIYTPITGGVDWVDLPVSLEDIARIEVTRGPNGVAYGANSFLGVINIITFHPADVQGFAFKTTLGEDQYRKGTMRYAGNEGALDYRLTVERREDSGLTDLNWDGAASKEANDDQRTTALTLRADYRATVNDYLTFHAGESRGPRERGYGPSEDDPIRWQQSHGDYQQLRWKHIHSSTEEFSVQVYRNYQLHSDSVVADIPPFVLGLDYTIETERYNLEFEHLFAPADDWRLAWGAEARIDYSRAPGYLGTPDAYKHNLYRLFANGEWQPDERWTVNVGALVEHNEFNRSNTSPRLAVNYRVDEAHYLRASYTEAYRTPAVFEERADAAILLVEPFPFPPLPAGTAMDQIYYSAGNLRPEHMTSYELGFGSYAADRRVGYEIKLYREEIRDVIAPYIDPAQTQDELMNFGSYKFTNDGSTNITGFEIQARVQPTDASLISLAYAYAHARGYTLDRVTPDEYIDMSVATPEHTLSLLLASRLSADWHGSLGLYHVTNFEWPGANDPVSFTTADATLRKQFRNNGAEGAMFFTVRDLLGPYYDYVNDVFLEKRVYFGIELQVP
ncbi:MAG: TonB-dependent receptor [Pseudomonadota bacterium]